MNHIYLVTISLQNNQTKYEAFNSAKVDVNQILNKYDLVIDILAASKQEAIERVKRSKLRLFKREALRQEDRYIRFRR